MLSFSDSLGAESSPQEVSLTTSILLKVRPRVSIEMAPRQKLKLLRLSRPRVRFDGQIRRGEGVILRNCHEQRSGSDTVDLERRVITSEKFNAAD